MLEIKNLSFTVPRETGIVEILKNIDLVIEDGTFAVITGPNGGGKTTLAKAVMGLVKPDGGSIIYNGTDISELSITDRAGLGICYGFQQPPRFKGMQVSDLLEIAAGRTLTKDESCEYLTQVGLCADDYLVREVGNNLSGGEMKRIEIASILVKNGSLMIFDEPEAGIDLWSFSRLTETFKNLHQSHKATILIISHQERIIRLADEIILVKDGLITMKGQVSEVFPYIYQDTAGDCRFMEER